MEKENKNLIRECENCKEKFEITDGEFSMYQKVGIELPVICFYCRVQQHLAFWLFGKFRKGKSDLSGENLITVLPEKTRYPIYILHEWHSDSWDGMDYGQNYSSKKSFLKQLQELQDKVPRPHQNGVKNINCDWCDDVWNSKNCYLSRSMDYCEDLYYSYRNIKVKNSIDVIVCFDSEKCFDSANCHNSYRIFYSKHSRNCINSYFLYDCRNCQDCFMCWNLRNKSYCIENVQYPREEYLEKIKIFKLDSYQIIQKFKKDLEKIIQEKVIHRENFNFKTYNSDGDNLLNDKNCHRCYMISDSEDCYNTVRGLRSKSCIDIAGCWNSELLGNCSSCDGGYAEKYCVWSSSRYSEYCDLCIECEYCFGCVGLKKKKYCILNKQYTKESFDKLRTQIIADIRKNDEYGKFLPYSMTPGPFNFSTSIFYFPETKKEDILNLGGYWEDINENQIAGMLTNELPDSINDVQDDICNQALICSETGWRFNIALNELNFYRENQIPLPRFHFDVRIKNNMQYLSILKPYSYQCCFCQKNIQAYYLPKWGYQNIACENCYKQNIN